MACRGHGYFFAASSRQDQISDLFGVRHQGEVARVELHRGCIHPFRQKSLQVGIDGLIELRYRIP